MKYLVIAYNDDTTLGIECDNWLVHESGCIITYGEDVVGIKDVVPLSNVKIITQVSQEDFEAHRIDDTEEYDDGQSESGTMGFPVS